MLLNVRVHLFLFAAQATVEGVTRMFNALLFLAVGVFKVGYRAFPSVQVPNADEAQHALLAEMEIQTNFRVKSVILSSVKGLFV